MRMFTSVSSVAAIAMKTPSRSSAPAYSRRSHSIDPSRASCSSSGTASGAISVTRPSQASSPSTFSSPISPPPTTTQRRPVSLRQAMYNGVSSIPCTQVWSQIPRRNWQTHSFPAYAAAGMVTPSLRCGTILVTMSGYFDHTSRLRGIHRERAVALSGPRALLMQAAHPLAVSGLLAHSTAVDEPYDRLARTAGVMGTIGWGSRADADRVTKRVRAMHRRVRGTIPKDVGPYAAGTPYGADMP